MFESGCLSKDIYEDKINTCKKRFGTDYMNEELENCIGLSKECMECISSNTDTDIQSKCCSMDHSEVVDDFLKTNISWVIPLIDISTFIVLFLILFLIMVIFY